MMKLYKGRRTANSYIILYIIYPLTRPLRPFHLLRESEVHM